MNIDSGEITAIIAVIGGILSTLGVTGIDSGVLNSAVNGIISVVTIGCALWSWYSHHVKNAS